MFTNAIMLAGIAGAAIPLVLHLLSRARCRTVNWGAMLFLDDVDSHPLRGARMRQWIILAARMLIVAMLAVALARPVLSARYGAPDRARPISVALVVDCSMSMALHENGRPRLQAARDAAMKVLGGLGPGDRVILLTSGAPDVQRVLGPTTDLQWLASRIGELQVSSGQARIDEALIQAARLLRDEPPGERAIYLVGDDQASNWACVDDAFARSWRDETLLRRSGEQALSGSSTGTGSKSPIRLTIIPIGSPGADNIAIDDVSFAQSQALAHTVADVLVQVRNIGQIARAGVPLKVRLGDGAVVQTEITLAAGAVTTLRLHVPVGAPGEAVLTASLDGAGATLAQQLMRVVHIIDPIRVLVVTPAPGVGLRAQSASLSPAFIATALAPFGASGRTGPDLAIVDNAYPETLSEVDLSQYRVVILSEVVRLDPGFIRTLERFVFDGGGLLVAPGSSPHIEELNASLYRDGAGVLPAKLSPPTPADGSGATTLLGMDLAHPIFRFLRGRADPVPSGLTVGRFYPVTNRLPDARILASYASGGACLVERAVGRGRVLLFTTSLTSDWNTLPLTSFYLPFVQSMVRFLATGMLPERNLSPGDAIKVSLAGAEAGARLRLIRPDGSDDSAALRLARSPDRLDVRYGDTRLPGQYTLGLISDQGERSIVFAVRTPASELDLRGLDEPSWQRYLQALDAARLDPQKVDIATVIASPRRSTPLAGGVIVLVIVLCVVELLLTRLWTEGRHGR